ncbi:hypothetical protein LTR94_027908, partial [Friedmanniomyces endolithicus]
MSLVNYGYSGEVYLPTAIEVPASATPGETLRLVVDALFMVCSDQMCVPVEMRLRLDLPVREGAPGLDPVHGRAIEAVLQSAPRAAGLQARIGQSQGRLVLSVSGGPLAGADLASAQFFPVEEGVIDHAADQTVTAGPQGVSLSMAPGGRFRNAAPSQPVSGVLATNIGAWEITAEPGQPLAGASGRTIAFAGQEGASGQTGQALGVGAWLKSGLLALAGGLILNLMPCVFPILAMKAASLAASAHQADKARRDGLLFGLGVLAAFLGLAALLLLLRSAGQAVGWGFQLQSPLVTGGLALVMLAVGLNLSGVFAVGTALQSAGSGRLGRLPGGLGAFFTGVLA